MQYTDSQIESFANRIADVLERRAQRLNPNNDAALDMCRRLDNLLDRSAYEHEDELERARR